MAVGKESVRYNLVHCCVPVLGRVRRRAYYNNLFFGLALLRKFVGVKGERDGRAVTARQRMAFQSYIESGAPRLPPWNCKSYDCAYCFLSFRPIQAIHLFSDKSNTNQPYKFIIPLSVNSPNRNSIKRFHHTKLLYAITSPSTSPFATQRAISTTQIQRSANFRAKLTVGCLE